MKENLFPVMLFAWAAVLPGAVKTHTEIIRSSQHSFEIQVAGTIDPENLEITIENAGDAAVKNPRVTVNGKYNWYNLESMLEEIIRGRATEQEKAMAIFDFVHNQTYWWSFPKDNTRMNPVRHFNIYGYHICSDSASLFVGLCRAAGIEARVWEIWHHTVAEAKWDGVWHHMDADLGLWYLKEDNRTIASMEELGARPEWVARTYKPYRWFLTPGDHRKMIYKPDGDTAGEGLANLYATTGDNFVQQGYDRWLYAKHTMDMALRPDEKIVRWWRPALGKYYDQASTHEPPRYANGQIIFEPDFSRRTYAGLIGRKNLKFKAEDGRSPAVHVDRLHDPVNDQPSSLSIPLESPYVIVGGQIDTTYYKGGTTGLDQVSLAADLDPVFHRPTNLWNYYSWAYGLGESRAVLDGKLSKDGPAATYQIRAMYTISANKKNEGPARFPLIYGGQSGVDRVRMVADIQVNPGSLPALSLGRNVIRYTDETTEPHAVRVTYKWRERGDQHVPDAPASAVSPQDGATGVSLAPKLAWAESKDADGDRIVNYRVQVSLRPDCAWPVVSTLDRDVRDGAAFQAPEGWLNRGTTYYWRVRAEDDKGNFGPWSRIFRFVTQ